MRHNFPTEMNMNEINAELKARGINALLCSVRIHEKVLNISSVTVLVSRDWVSVTPKDEVVKTLFKKLVKATRFDPRPKFNIKHKRPRRYGMLNRMVLDSAVSVTSKTCCRCKAEKDADDFGRCAKAKDGLQSLCKECFRAYYIKSKS